LAIFCFLWGEFDSLTSSLLTSAIGVLFTVFIIETLFREYDTEKEKEAEKRRIIRVGDLVLFEMERYKGAMYYLTTPSDAKKDFSKMEIKTPINLCDMRDLYYPIPLVHVLGQSCIRFYEHSLSILIERISDMIYNVDFKHYPEICDTLKYFIKTYDSISPLYAVLFFERKDLQEHAREAILNYSPNKNYGSVPNLIDPYIMLKDLMESHLKTMDRFKKQITELSQ
jgi:hypothetical protein